MSFNHGPVQLTEEGCKQLRAIAGSIAGAKDREVPAP
jgi:hypothetical protein